MTLWLLAWISAVTPSWPPPEIMLFATAEECSANIEHENVGQQEIGKPLQTCVQVHFPAPAQ